MDACVENPILLWKNPLNLTAKPWGAFFKVKWGGGLGFGLHEGKKRAEVCDMEQQSEETATTGKPEAWVTLEGVAGHLVASTDTIRRWIRERGMPAHKAGGMWRFKISEVDEWVRSNRKGDKTP